LRPYCPKDIGVILPQTRHSNDTAPHGNTSEKQSQLHNAQMNTYTYTHITHAYAHTNTHAHTHYTCVHTHTQHTHTCSPKNPIARLMKVTAP
jgi:hypothetical protein